MRFIKKMAYDENSAWYVDKADMLTPFIVAVVTLATSVMLLVSSDGFYAPVGYILMSVVGAVGIVSGVWFVYRAKVPYNVVVDDEYLYLRKGSGYLKIHKFDIGSVLYRQRDEECVADGHGVERFTIEKRRIVFHNAIKPIKRAVRNGQKLAYVLISVVQNPHSGIDWAVAYESLPENKRAPSAF